MIRPGMTVCSKAGDLRVDQELGSGGQGVVFSATRADGAKRAIKWYEPPNQQERLRKSLELLVRDGAPSRHFLWPEAIVTHEQEFGYVMELRDPALASIPALLKRRVSTKPSRLARAAINTVSAFRALHAKGLYYCDISDGNLFFNPSTGEIRICDNDNVGSSMTTPGLVLGTPYYMAPEIVRAEEKPSPMTDAFSLAVLLFLLLFNGHPLLGAAEARIRSMDMAALQYLFGTNPVYIFDRKDRSNRPVPGIHDNPAIFRGLYPTEILDVFERAFTVGLHDPAQRPPFADWLNALCALEDSVFLCAGCGRENFAPAAHGAVCWGCRSPLVPPLRLHLPRRVVSIRQGMCLYRDHIVRSSDPGLRDRPIAEVVTSPRDPRALGLKNLGTTQWFLTRDGASAQVVEPGRSARLAAGYRIGFGPVEGTVRTT